MADQLIHERPTTKSCDCPKCVSLCERVPGMGTVDEMAKAIDAGMAGRLMLDWQVKDDGSSIEILAPASLGHEGARAKSLAEMLRAARISRTEAAIYRIFEEAGEATPLRRLRKGCCNFLKSGKCEIHASGFKPWQCRAAMGCASDTLDDFPENPTILKLWDTDAGRALVERWKDIVKFEERALA